MITDPELALEEAEKRDPGNSYVASCREHYKKCGWLSKRQLESLAAVTKTFRAVRKDLGTSAFSVGAFGADGSEYDSYEPWELPEPEY